MVRTFAVDEFSNRDELKSWVALYDRLDVLARLQVLNATLHKVDAQRSYVNDIPVSVQPFR